MWRVSCGGMVADFTLPRQAAVALCHIYLTCAFQPRCSLWEGKNGRVQRSTGEADFCGIVSPPVCRGYYTPIYAPKSYLPYGGVCYPMTIALSLTRLCQSYVTLNPMLVRITRLTIGPHRIAVHYSLLSFRRDAVVFELRQTYRVKPR